MRLLELQNLSVNRPNAYFFDYHQDITQRRQYRSILTHFGVFSPEGAPLKERPLRQILNFRYPPDHGLTRL